MSTSITPGSSPSARRPWLLPALLVLLVALPIAEVWLLVQLGHAIGGLATVALLVIEAAFGAWLLKREGRRTWTALRNTIGQGQVPGTELADAAIVLVGGVLFILPGLVTDLVGLVCLLPFTRPLARRLVLAVAAEQARRRGLDLSAMRATASRLNLDGQTIEGETVDSPASGSQPGQAGHPRRIPVGEIETVTGEVID